MPDGLPPDELEQQCARQLARRQRAARALCDSLNVRCEVNFHPNVRQVSDETYLCRLRFDPAFRPLRTYIERLKVYRDGRWTGAWQRPILRGELGMIGPTIYTLQVAYGAAVPVGVELCHVSDQK